ncbi:hypothetical protein [Streptomyces sp. GC420]|uniref:hypothetical protein n=1 Tax=Streptomyces sp. GC420 TaxID=2697568 RepID=UPI001414CD0A|nr:hypothetical protein [Streptomyces sp. GC420]NBM18931.1 hypothetical protein [Streptomyces sp. GC420]
MAAVTAVLSWTATGCVTVHGEREIIPSVTRAEAAEALTRFTVAYNAADKAYNPALDSGRVTGALGAINQAGLKAKQATSPQGNPSHSPLELTDARFAIPEQRGWPKWFLADTDSNRDRDSGPDDTRWLLVFTRDGAGLPWEAAYLSILTPDEIPEFATDADGWAEPVPADAQDLAVAPRALGPGYAAYLKNGGGVFADGQHTSDWRAERVKNANRPGISTQYVDQALDTEAFAPVGLRTKDGSALVFFATRHYEQQTAASGVRLNISADVKALMTGEARSTVTLERVSNQAVLVPSQESSQPQVVFLNRIQGLTGAKGA